MKQFKKFIPFSKVDAVKREVYGIVTAEVVDKDGEVCDYDSTVPHYKAWNEEFAKATDGKSIGNLREMHGLSAVGKGVSVEFRDSDKEIWMGFKVVDDTAWQKVEEGVYTGFSQGGDYVRKWKENGKEFYTAKPSEVSLVDNPCLGVAHFAYVKADGQVEMRKIRAAVPEPKKENESITKIKAIGDKLDKGMYQVANMACLLDDIKFLMDCSENEAIWEDDERDAEIAKKLGEWLKTGIELLQQIVEEETSELVAETAIKAAAKGDNTMLTAEEKAALNKAAKGAKDHLDSIKKASDAHHEKVTDMIDKCMKALGGEAAEKTATPAVEKTEVTDFANLLEAAVAKAVKPLNDKIEAIEKAKTDELEKTAVKGTLVGRDGIQIEKHEVDPELQDLVTTEG